MLMGQSKRTAKQDQGELERRRLKAAKLFDKGVGPTEVAEKLSVSVHTVNHWKARWRRGGVDALRSQGSRGRPSRLSEEQLSRLHEELLRGPRAHGYATDLWTCPRVGTVIERLFGVTYADCHVWKLLRKMGWTRQKPARRAKERDEERIENWVATSWPRIKRGL